MRGSTTSDAIRPGDVVTVHNGLFNYYVLDVIDCVNEATVVVIVCADGTLFTWIGDEIFERV